MIWLWLSLAGGAGALARHELAVLMQKVRWRPSPATLVVNTLGSSLLGFFMEAMDHNSLGYVVLTSGFLGGFTTFSTWTVETVGMGSGRLRSFLNVVWMMVAGVAGYLFGRLAGSA